MRAKLALIPFLTCACVVSSTEPLTTDEALEEDINEYDDSEYDDSDEDVLEEESEEALPSVNVQSGVWSVSLATLKDDPCDWNTQLTQFFGVGSDALLPSDFTVAGYEDAFEIEANSYGASGPIECSIEGMEFTCETQSVTPVDFDLGSYGWTYAIDFSGELNDERSLEGTAFVRFPTVSEFLIPIFESAGIDVTQCTQTYELSILNEL